MNLKISDLRTVLQTEIPKILKEYGVLIKNDLPAALKEYGVATKTDLRKEILASEERTDIKLKKLERSLAIKITKPKNDLAQRIASVAVAKEERSKVERIENRVTTLENFVYA